MNVVEAVEAERELARHLDGFAGRWVAEVDREIVSKADSLGALLEQLDEGTAAVATVFQVPAGSGSVSYF
ncbi:MAG: hypothetical protein J2O48_04030 [Solirubrobacterales bacterium]|nr:hypothetical protein [Solirubrobacterales bacterium]